MIGLNADQLGAPPDNSPVNLNFVLSDPELLHCGQITTFRLKAKHVEVMIGEDGITKCISLIGVDRNAAEAMGLINNGD